MKAKRLGLVIPMEGIPLKNGEKRTRPPFSDKWIREKLLAPGALDGLNLEARCLLLGMVNTGYRPSEGAGLLPEHIRLDGDVPHISIQPVGRALKSQYSRRMIPLVGPNGFPRYRGSPNVRPPPTSSCARTGFWKRISTRSTACGTPSRIGCSRPR
ncbi:hypothetical protein [Cereibacter johrii]|uniref:hypothetical protein n=1 Tax=Cereibacter johrii TaxID=445629 RepID=UPI000B1839E9|nr:hypothetical protein [Cereibacter johrii]